MDSLRKTASMLGLSAVAVGLVAGCAAPDDPAEDGHEEVTVGSVQQAVSDRWRAIAEYGEQLGFRVTSTTGGTHNPGSAHAQGRAVDFSVKNKTPAEVEAFMQSMRDRGYVVRDERTRPPGQPVWSGPHIHVEDRRP